ncbi:MULTISPECIES: hemolysin family protein [Sporomusa]|jgi:CBS domain containing-hemolysin-like protein|uniref:Magnesium and cobalt efflux protein CorC n=1 Tax=Sporomusa sphaeroides DSM 2875 TaxID=1337886 RepID=A0ABP2C0Q3_9FIRM|nr:MULTISPECIES: hemolysin family protein [Sporomusa]MCM0759994.1 hemolysin family protein [Sporomusa sphaeroides DSM 2875]OLS58383.1 magnesium and cobalt efflux protein CorC [Sporomusa sphaeroides DSM 2875]CVK17430.1 Magnesium and cobalt efflux protein CorC [Sporomusa sphaeroides DSM 2875]HML31690.1 hemolysin family protein [Sporomusa sphaeroides]
MLLVLTNAFFVLAEFSLVKIRKTRLEELAHQGNGRAKIALKVVNSFDTYLGATQLGITLTSLALGWLGESAISALIGPLLLNYIPVSEWLISTISIVIGFMTIVFLHIVLGELVPKSMAIQHPENLALACAWPLYIFHKAGYLFILLCNQAAKSILGLMGIKAANQAELTHSEEELRMIVSASHRGGVLNQMESELIDNVFDFADRLAREIMVPRQDMICLFADDSFEENMRVVRETGHTRYPLCLEDKDHIIGMIHIRDIMDFDLLVNNKKDLTAIVREILVVPEGMSVAHLLQVMRRKRTHLAIVADEYGGTAGLVAMEDVIEEIVGDIQDEHDDVTEEVEIQRLPDGSYEFDGGVLLDDVTELLNIRLDEHEEDTLGGYIFGMLGRRPEAGDKVDIGDYSFEVLHVNGFRIVRVKAVPLLPLQAVAEA